MTRSLLFLASALTFPVACGSVETTAPTTTGAGGAATTTSSTSSTASSSASSSTGGIACPPACEPGFTCCGGVCVNLQNDIHNCGTCAHECLGEHPFCGSGNCQDPPCAGVKVCKGAEFCCASECCAGGMLCCEVPGPGPSGGAKCTAPENGTCPLGCPLCK